MTTPTPRTDAAEAKDIAEYEMMREAGDPPYSGGTMADFARQLEMELNRLAKAHKNLLDHHYWPEYTAKAMKDLGLNATDYE